MKRLIAFLLAVVFCVTLFSPTITATDWDISEGPRPDYTNANELISDMGDDGGWHENDSTGPDSFMGDLPWWFMLNPWLGGPPFLVGSDRIDNHSQPQDQDYADVRPSK